MKIELSKREIEAILEIMEYGITFLVTHGSIKAEEDNKKEKSILEQLEELREEIRKMQLERASQPQYPQPYYNPPCGNCPYRHNPYYENPVWV